MFCFLLVQYAQSLYGYIKEWRKNPHWSLSCCLALLLPLNDLQGEIHGMAGTNIVDTQLDTGNFELTTFSSAVCDSGVIDVTLEEGEQTDDKPEDVPDRRCHTDMYKKLKCHQETQTELLSLLVVTDEIVVHMPAQHSDF